MDQKGSFQNLQKVLINKYICMSDFVRCYPDLSSLLMHKSQDWNCIIEGQKAKGKDEVLYWGQVEWNQHEKVWDPIQDWDRWEVFQKGCPGQIQKSENRKYGVKL